MTSQKQLPQLLYGVPDVFNPLCSFGKTNWWEERSPSGSECSDTSNITPLASSSSTPLSGSVHDLAGACGQTQTIQNIAHLAPGSHWGSAIPAAGTAAGAMMLAQTSIHKLPEFAVPLQPKLLKQINSFATKEDLLQFISTCHVLLDQINLVTCVYRLARMYCNIRSPEERQMWTAELSSNTTFQLLLRTIQSQMLHAQLQLMHHEGVKGLDARCVSNLIWAIIKLEVATEPGCLGFELVHNVSPLVIHFLPTSSSQGLANLMWAYSKMPIPPTQVMMVITAEMAKRLDQNHVAPEFDAQALSNSVWALAHTRSKLSELDDVAGTPGSVMHFLLGVAACVVRMLGTLRTRVDPMQLQSSMLDSERRFSCQALVNIVWSFASMLGDECNKAPIINQMFRTIRHEAILRLRATATALQSNQQWIYRLQGGFNEQALSNIVYAYDKAEMLDKDLLQWVFTVATFRLEKGNGMPTFKPQELCTLLRAAQLQISQPWPFLDKLFKIVMGSPHIIESWSKQELSELERAFTLLHKYSAPLLVQQQQQAQRIALVQPQHAVQIAYHCAPLNGVIATVPASLLGSSLPQVTTVTTGELAAIQQLQLYFQQQQQQQQQQQLATLAASSLQHLSLGAFN
eukprot:CAMPEP_0202890262 /NCGR_PEP_ID=MMETSP1392-20130828/735_1 /ASSEMBLY_ACC=CAM_ASM_000868 /TAXON_ID=225041 /ORGANISM="Chlamydomonas chlamydogama, Strain SAG 11-48b" /LENGTH=628 /DNA_ID=CAMNT_0049573799 /DNA_START=109 /DNA_END=1995 /DNA_ORIENTATION=+